MAAPAHLQHDMQLAWPQVERAAYQAHMQHWVHGSLSCTACPECSQSSVPHGGVSTWSFMQLSHSEGMGPKDNQEACNIISVGMRSQASCEAEGMRHWGCHSCADGEIVQVSQASAALHVPHRCWGHPCLNSCLGCSLGQKVRLQGSTYV